MMLWVRTLRLRLRANLMITYITHVAVMRVRVVLLGRPHIAVLMLLLLLVMILWLG